MSTRFDLEQAIMNCWCVVDDLDTLFEEVCESDKIDQDMVANILLGTKQLYHLKFRKLFDMFEDMIHQGTIK